MNFIYRFISSKYLFPFQYFCVVRGGAIGAMMFTKLSEKNLYNLPEISQGTIRDSIQKMRVPNQKLMVFEVLTSKLNIFCQISPEANTLTKRILGVNVMTLQAHPNSNLRAFSYVLIQALTQNNFSLQAVREVGQKLALLKENPPNIVNYLFSQKFKPSQMLQIFSAMQPKIVEMVEGGLVVNEILKVYSCYLQLTSFFLRSLLSNVGMTQSQDSLQKLPTSQIYSILSEYLDLTYLVNKNIFLFPDIKVFIGSVDDKEFVFGRYYENNDDLLRNETQIRQSTMDYINRGNQKHQSMKISKLNLDITMSEFMFPDKLTQFPGISSKAPTPQFGNQCQFHGFEEMLGYNSQQQGIRISTPKQQNQKQTKPETLPQIPTENEQEHLRQDEISKQFKKLHRESVFTQNVFNQEINPTGTGKNIIGSNFYLHEFDFYHRTNKEHDRTMEKFCSQRVLLKGSSMVEKGQLFLQQVGQLKKQIESQMMDRQRDRRKNKNSSLHESISAQTFNQNQRRNKNLSPLSQNGKSQVNCDKKSSHSEVSKRMALNSEVYHLNIENQQKSKSIDKYVNVNKSKDKLKNKTIPLQNYSRSKSKTKVPNRKESFAAPSIKVKPPTEVYQSPRIDQPRLSYKNYVKPAVYRGSQIPQIFSDQNNRFSNQNHNHIHIHIHNDNKMSGIQNKSFHVPVKIQRHPKQTDIHYQVNDNNLQHAFQSTIPQIIKQIQNNQNIEKLKNSGRNQLAYSSKQYNQTNPDKFFGLAKSEKLMVPPLAKNNFVKIKTLSNMESQKLLSNQRSLNMKKIKSQDGINNTYQLKRKNDGNLNMIKQGKKCLHVPAFLKKKQALKNDKDDSNYSVNKSVERNNSKSLKISNPHPRPERDVKGSSHCSPRPVDESKQKIKLVPHARKKCDMNIYAKLFGKCSTDLETPTFTSPQNLKHKQKYNQK